MLNIVKVTYEDGTQAIVGPNHGTRLEAERLAGCALDSWNNVVDAEVLHHIPPVKIRLSNGRIILKGDS